MYLTVGEISKALEISTEMIRFYVKEGIITPKKNKENNYWVYSSDDLMRLTDVLFYRDLDLSLKDIKTIMGGLALEKIGDVIQDRRSELIKEIQKKVKSLSMLQEWDEDYHKEINLVGKFKQGNMPAELRKEDYYDEMDHIAKYMQGSLKLDREDWMYVSLSFFYNIYEKDFKLKKYLSVNKTLKTQITNGSSDIIEEKAERCIYTEVYYSESISDMINPLIEYAEKNGYELTGEIYGRENTNYFENGKRLALYKVYAIIK